MGFFERFFKSEPAPILDSETSDTSSPPSDQLNQIHKFLSSSTSEQAAAVHETMASIEQIRMMLSQTDQQVAKSLNLAEQAKKLCEERLETVDKMRQAIHAIEESNQLLKEFQASLLATTNKTKVINDIVTKTQLLSFNASIEAARSGQYGKGFAVVADEVGRLAQTTGRAAKEIEALINESQQRADSVVAQVTSRAAEGADVSANVIKGFIDVTQIINQISESLTAMSQASHQQLQGMEQATIAIEKISKFSESNRKNAESILQLSKKQSETLSPFESEKLKGLVENISSNKSTPVTRISDVDPDDPSFNAQS